MLPPALLAAARAHDFPLIVYRQEVSFAQLTRAAHARILQPPAAVSAPALTPLLDALHETGRSLPFMEAHLGPLLSLPPRPRTTLMQTLGALLESNFNVAQAARRLGVRRQSIYYRLEQLRAMLGDLEEPSGTSACTWPWRFIPVRCRPMCRKSRKIKPVRGSR